MASRCNPSYYEPTSHIYATRKSSMLEELSREQSQSVDAARSIESGIPEDDKDDA